VAAGPVSLPGGPWRPADLAACGSGRPAGWGGRLRLAGGLLAALLCMASFGLITWIVVALYAAYRRSPRLAWAAVGYAVLGVGWVLLVPLDPVPYFHLRMIGGLLAILLCAVGGGAHVGYLAVRPRLG
jgi:hypothetical protein